MLLKKNSASASTLPTENGKMRKRGRSLSTASDTISSCSSNEDIGEQDTMDKQCKKMQHADTIGKSSSAPEMKGTSTRHLASNYDQVNSTFPKPTEDHIHNKNKFLNRKQGRKDSLMAKVSSMPSLQLIPQDDVFKTEQISSETNPVDFMKSIIKSNGFDARIIPSLSVKNYFQPVTEEHVAAYDNEITDAIRKENLEALLRLKSTGKSMECCNRFGESIMHMACRRGSTEIVSFLMKECNSSIRLRDDFGRTPLHDACWTARVEFEIVKMLLIKEPDLLVMSDKRGHTPLDYVRRDSWLLWCKFLDENRHLLSPRCLNKKEVK